MKKARKNYTPEEKVAILRKHLIEKETVSEICDRLDLQPTVLYRWLKESLRPWTSCKDGKQRSSPNAIANSKQLANNDNCAATTKRLRPLDRKA